MKNNTKSAIWFLLVAFVLVGAFALTALALDGTEPYDDAMEDILADVTLSQNKIETYKLENDGYLGIPVEFTYYYDYTTHGAPKTGYNGTPLIMYVVNTRTERTGTDSDVSIIKSMLSRGYIVAVADYKYHAKSVSDDIDWSTQTVMASLRTSAYFTDSRIKGGSYNESFIVPAGHDVSLGHIYWEFDKHAVLGTLDKIVEVWNEDFRGYKAEMYVKWANGTQRKATQNGYDGTAPVWYSYDSETNTYTRDDENGLYIKVKHTKAEKITDCVKPDGTPIDLNLYLHVVYPTNPEKSVPVLTLASSSEHLASGAANAVRPHSYGFAFEGYAVAMFDYAYIPMARNDHYGYFDGSSPTKGSVTGDNMTYSLGTYNSAYVGPAALRYIRYLALTNPETFDFRTDKIGVIGNSKASAYTPLADLDLCEVKSLADGYTEETLLQYAQGYLGSFVNQYYLYGHHGETRYEMGEQTYTENGFTIDGGELQPWMIHDGKMIPSGAQFVYSCCGANYQTLDENYAPLFTTGHIDGESSAYGNNGDLANYARCYDIPMVYFEVSLGHTFVARENKDYDVDPYVAYKDYVHYVLADGPVSVIGTNPICGAEISLASSINLKFAGCVSESEIAKVTLTDKDGNAVVCSFVGSYGGTEWQIKPHALRPDTEYTLTVPATLIGKNGVAIREEYKATFRTEKGSVTNLGVNTALNLTNTSGAHLSLTVPDLTAYNALGVNRAEVRFFVSNDAANAMEIYLVESNTATSGELLARVPLAGVGSYTADLTEILSKYEAGTNLTLYLKPERASGTFAHTTTAFTTEDFDDNQNSFSVNGINPWNYATVDEEHGKSMQVYLRYRTSSGVHKYYSTNVCLQKEGMILDNATEADVGRRFRVSFEVYDTIERTLRVRIRTATNSAEGVADYDASFYNFHTKANQWTTFTFETVIKSPDYGKTGLGQIGFSLYNAPSGDTNKVLYLDNFRMEEIVSDVSVSEASLVLSTAGGDAYKAPEANLPFAVGDTTYATFAEALGALGETNTITLKSNITLDDENVFSGIKGDIVLDLNGYSIRTKNVTESPFVLGNDVSSLIIKNGSIYLSATSLLSYDNVTKDSSFVVALDNVYVGTEMGAMVREVLTASDAPEGVKVTLRLALTDCDVDLRAERFTKNPVVMLPMSSENLSIQATFTAGSITLTKPHKVRISTNAKAVTFVAENGEYPAFYLTAGRAFTASDMALADDSFRYFELKTDNAVGYDLYHIVKTDLCTPFGVIPVEYANAEKYPFVIFDRDSDVFFSASDVFATDNDGGALWTLYHKGSGKHWGIYLRRDFTHNTGKSLWNMAFLAGEITIDLGGHTFTNANNAGNGMLVGQAKRDFNTTVIFRNGTMNSAVSKPIYYATNHSTAQVYTVGFENITFTVSNGAKPSVWVSQTNASSGGTLFTNTVYFENCTFDTSGLIATTVIAANGNANNVINDTLIFRGCDIKGDMTNLGFVSRTESVNATVAYEKGANGQYFTNTRLTTSPTPSQVINTPEGAMTFTNPIATDGEYTTYGLASDPLVTPYGKIPEEYANAEEYPVIMFNIDTGAVVLATKYLANNNSDSALGLADDRSGNYAIYLRGDVTTNGVAYNHGNAGGSIIIDLNGHKVTLGNSLFWTQSKSGASQSVRVINGEIANGAYNMINIGGATAVKTMNYVFENVIFSNINGGALVRDGIDDRKNITVNVTFKDCIFHVANANASFVTLGASTLANVNVAIVGGYFNSTADTIPVMFTIQAQDNKKISVEKGSDGNYPYVVTAPSTSISNGVALSTTDGTVYFVKDETTEENTIYRIGQKTPYGYIPEKWLDAQTYPIVAFNVNTGEALFATALLTGEGDDKAFYPFCNGAYKGAGNYALLLRRDYSQSGGNNWWMGALQADLVFDLGTNTLTLTSRLYAMQTRRPGHCTLTTKNGTIVVNSQMVLDVGGTHNDKSMDVVFEDIIFDNIKVGVICDNQGSTKVTTWNVTYKNCTFNVSGACTTPVFNLGNTDKNATVNVKVLGGKFNFAVAEPNIYATKGVANKTVTFGMYNGEYPAVTLVGNTANPSTTVMSTDGKLLGLRKTSSGYVFSSETFVSAYVNLKNGINLVYRVFLPYGSSVESMIFVLNGIDTELTEYVIDENGFYCFTLTEIGPHLMGDTISATVNATVNGKPTTLVNDTLTIKSYLESVKGENATNAALVALCDDLLLYGAYAQLYMNHNTTNLVRDLVTMDAIVEDENTLTLDGMAASDVGFAACGLYLDGAFALRVTVYAENTQGLKLEITKGEDKQIIDLSTLSFKDNKATIYYDNITASELDTDVTFALVRDGVTVGQTLTYSANAYLYRISLSQDEALANLAKALYAYGKSAKAYNS